jgi:uncharacterized membrane protein
VSEEATMEEAVAQTPESTVAVMLTWVEHAATGIEFLAVTIIVAVILTATLRYLSLFLCRRADQTTFADYRHRVARALLLGLEILVAADVVRTVVLEPTLLNVLVLGLLVLIRTFLSWTLVVEIEERWPWQAPRVSREGSRTSTTGPSTTQIAEKV